MPLGNIHQRGKYTESLSKSVHHFEHQKVILWILGLCLEWSWKNSSTKCCEIFEKSIFCSSKKFPKWSSLNFTILAKFHNFLFWKLCLLYISNICWKFSKKVKTSSHKSHNVLKDILLHFTHTKMLSQPAILLLMFKQNWIIIV
jgi:hypothetical protein